MIDTCRTVQLGLLWEAPAVLDISTEPASGFRRSSHAECGKSLTGYQTIGRLRQCQSTRKFFT